MRSKSDNPGATKVNIIRRGGIETLSNYYLAVTYREASMITLPQPFVDPGSLFSKPKPSQHGGP